MARRQGGLPDLALLQLAVAQEHEDAHLVALVEPRPERHADTGREPLAEGARRHVDPGGVDVGMTLQDGADLVVGGERIGREVAALHERDVVDHRGVALGEDEAVAVLPLRVRRIDAHDLEVQGGQDLGHAQ